jgi:hypothetical protein
MRLQGMEQLLWCKAFVAVREEEGCCLLWHEALRALVFAGLLVADSAELGVWFRRRRRGLDWSGLGLRRVGCWVWDLVGHRGGRHRAVVVLRYTHFSCAQLGKKKGGVCLLVKVAKLKSTPRVEVGTVRMLRPMGGSYRRFAILTGYQRFSMVRLSGTLQVISIQ